ncbi:MAG: carboxymuconolactone decarboxylase family protein [Endozoicomonas sp.]
MARIDIPEGKGSEAERLFRLNAPTAMAQASVSGAIYSQKHLSMREREAIRMRIAIINQCQICLGFRFPELVEQGVTEEFYAQVEHWRDSPDLSTREKLAVEYTERFILDHLNIDDAFFERFRAHYRDEEILEMTGIIGGLLANGRMLQVLSIDQQCAIDIRQSEFA